MGASCLRSSSRALRSIEPRALAVSGGERYKLNCGELSAVRVFAISCFDNDEDVPVFVRVHLHVRDAAPRGQRDPPSGVEPP